MITTAYGGGLGVGAEQVLPAETVARISGYGTAAAAMTPTDVTLPVLRTITNNFCQERKLGQGTFGQVYLGEYENGQKVAVKLLYNREPDSVSKQFQNEFDNLMKLDHTNIVRLMGFCYETKHVAIPYNGNLVLAEEATRALILEYLQNGSLQRHLSTNADEELDWHTRYKIIKGICEGLKYMHEELRPPVLHLDLKPDNILLDQNMVPKLADFGLSRICDQGTQITSCLIGTRGYQPPEYLGRNVVSKKFDIFSLGVIMIKIIEERHSDYYTSDDTVSDNFVDTVQMKWRSKLSGTCNGSLLDTYCRQVKICTEIALQCMECKRRRPNIVEIIDKLNAMEHEMGMFENNQGRHIERDPRMIMPTSEEQISAQLIAAHNFLLPAEMEARPLRYSYSTTKGSTGLMLTELKGITDDFSENRKLGAGSFGKVYLGEKENGKKVAVKILDFDGLGPDAEDFKVEFDRLMKVEHPNIVCLIDYCYETQYEAVPYNGRLVMTEKTTRALCLEYLHNGSLENHLSNEDVLDWHTRYRIIKGTCEGLKYIHKERQAVHLNLKPSNILLDEHMVPKLGDLGMAEIFKGYIGTREYQPPEYIERRLISEKFDIFSLGIIILKIVAGKRGYSKYRGMNSEQFADDVQRIWRKRWDNGTLVGSILDTHCRQVKLCTEIALKCVEHERIRRPNIVEIIDKLNRMEIKPCPPPPPGCVSAYAPKQSIHEPEGPEDTSAELQVRRGPSSSDLLSIHPLRLRFPSTPSGGSPISSKLHLINNTNDRVAFRLLSKGHPIRDLEGPTCGVVPPKSKLTLAVTLRRPVSSGGFFELVSTRAGDEDLLLAQDPPPPDFLYQHSSFINRAKEAGREVHSVKLATNVHTQTAVCFGPWFHFRRENLRRLFVDCFLPAW
ncbi:receptor like protein kinase S.2-like isoform X3 [Miscanthus floridulus]